MMVCIVVLGCAGTETSQPPVTYTEQSPRYDHSSTVDSLSELMLYYDSLHEKETHRLAEEYEIGRAHV